MVKDDRHKTRDLIYNGKEVGIQEYPLVYNLYMLFKKRRTGLQ